jgi:hypothetical protein
MAGHRAGGGEEVSVGCIIATVHFSCACCGKSFFEGQEALTAGRMPIFKALLREYGQWEATPFPRLTHRGGVPADIIQAILANAMQS